MSVVAIERYTEMDTHFGIEHTNSSNDTNDAKRVSEVIQQMTRQELSDTVSVYQLLPVYYYLNVLRDSKETIPLSAFAKYIDIYLLEITGNNRTALNTFARTTIGDDYPISSAKAMRHTIIINLLSIYR